MKNLIFPLLIILVTGTCFAGPLDILDASGNFDGRFGHTSSSDASSSEISFDMSQGVRFSGAPWIEPYIGFTKYQQLNIANTEWISMGLKNKSFLPPFTFGIEYRNIIEPSDSPSSNLTVAYVSVYKDWNLKEK